MFGKESKLSKKCPPVVADEAELAIVFTYIFDYPIYITSFYKKIILCLLVQVTCLRQERSECQQDKYSWTGDINMGQQDYSISHLQTDLINRYKLLFDFT